MKPHAVGAWEQRQQPQDGVRMNKFGAVIFLLGTLLSGVFVLGMMGSTERSTVPIDAVINDQTTYDEVFHSYYICTANIEFTYSVNGQDYGGIATGSMQSSQSCVDEIEASYSIDSEIRIYYWDDVPSDYTFNQESEDTAFLYGCCAAFFGILAVIGLVVTFSMGSPGSSSTTGGLSGRVKNLSGQNSTQIKPENEHYQTLPSQQHLSRDTKSKPRNRWKGDRMTQARIRNYDSILNRLNLKKRNLSNIMEAKGYVMTSGIMNQRETDKFFANSHVISTLGLLPDGEFKSSSMSQSKPKENFWSQSKISTSKGSSDGSCGDLSCSNSVDSFDFRCFDCRKRFCSQHRGKTFKCAACAN